MFLMLCHVDHKNRFHLSGVNYFKILNLAVSYNILNKNLFNFKLKT